MNEAIEIDTALKRKLVPQLKTRYLNSRYNKDKVNFDDLPAQAQTVIASVSFQYGALDSARNTFWQAVSKQDRAEGAKILRGYKDYLKRRGREADLLEQLIVNEKKIAEVLSSISVSRTILLFAFFLGVFGIGASAQTTTIFDKNLAIAYRGYDRSMTEKRTALEFESGKEVTNCSEYAKEKKLRASKKMSSISFTLPNIWLATRWKFSKPLEPVKTTE